MPPLPAADGPTCHREKKSTAAGCSAHPPQTVAAPATARESCSKLPLKTSHLAPGGVPPPCRREGGNARRGRLRGHWEEGRTSPPLRGLRCPRPVAVVPCDPRRALLLPPAALLQGLLATDPARRPGDLGGRIRRAGPSPSGWRQMGWPMCGTQSCSGVMWCT